MRRGARRVTALLGALALASACATPIGVTRGDTQTLYRHDGHIRSGGRMMAELEESELLANGSILGHVTARLPHQPDGGVRRRFSPAGLQKRM